MINILIVGNDQVEWADISSRLEEQLGQVTLRFCDDEETAIDIAHELKPDVILIEFKFNNNGGRDFCNKLKNRSFIRHIPIVLINEAQTSSGERIKGMLAGADSFLSKPIDLEELAALINVMLRIKTAEDELRRKNEELSEQVAITTNELSKKEKRYADMFNAAANIIILIGKTKIIEEWNEAAENIFELKKSEVIGKNFEDIFLNRVMRADINDKINTETGINGKNEYQINIKTKTGRKFQVLWTISQLTDAKGKLSSILVIGQDVTSRVKEEQERKRSEAKLRSNYEFLNTLMNSIPSPIYYKNTNDEYLGCNNDFADFYGLKPSQIIGKKTTDINSAYFAKKIVEEDLVVFKTGGKQVKEISTTYKDGKNKHFILNKVAFYNPDESIGGLVGIMVDVTRLKQMEEELRQSEMFFKGITDSANDAIILIDKNYKIYFWNKSSELLFGYKKEEILNKLFYQILSDINSKKVFAEKVGKILNYKQESIQSNIFELEANNKNGDSFPVEFSVSGIQIRKANYVIIIAKDISLRKEAEESLLIAKEKAEEADRLKSAFLSNMSHEIRTPMNAIVGFSQLLGNSAISDEKKQVFIEQINLNSDSLMQLIEDIIYVSKIEAGKVEITKSMCLMNAALDELHTSFVEHKKRMGKEHIELIVEKSIDDQYFSMLTDVQRFKQIFTNLIGNAIKFTEEGSVTFGYEKKDDNTLLFYVKDTGLGINKEKLKYIFDRFTKVSATKTKLYGGTGLGLSISQHLVRCLGGEIWAESEEDKGSVFYFTHPFQGEDMKSEPQIVDENKDTDMSLENTNILIAEDEQMNYFFLQEALIPTGAKIKWARNGQEAVNFVENSSEFDVVLMDMKMPIMDGYEATSKIKKMKPALPIIAQTAYAMPEEQEKGFQAGCDSYLSKPVDPDLLISTIRKHLKRG
jgi:PAS domain S-box-containing protein